MVLDLFDMIDQLYNKHLLNTFMVYLDAVDELPLDH